MSKMSKKTKPFYISLFFVTYSKKVRHFRHLDTLDIDNGMIGYHQIIDQ